MTDPIQPIASFNKMLITRSLITATCALMGWIGACAQGGSGFRLSPYHADFVVRNNGFAPGAVVMGFDHDLGDHLAVSLEATVLWRNILNSDPKEEHGLTPDGLDYEGWNASFMQDTRSWGLTYRTAYFFSGNSDGGVYLGSVIGIRHIARTIVINDQNYWGSWPQTVSDPPFKQKYTAEKKVIPVGLRFGYRSVLDGFYLDAYFGLGYQIGGGKNLFAQPEMADAPTTLAGLTYTLGLAYGIGWAK